MARNGGGGGLWAGAAILLLVVCAVLVGLNLDQLLESGGDGGEATGTTPTTPGDGEVDSPTTSPDTSVGEETTIAPNPAESVVGGHALAVAAGFDSSTWPEVPVDTESGPYLVINTEAYNLTIEGALPSDELVQGINGFLGLYMPGRFDSTNLVADPSVGDAPWLAQAPW